MQTDRRTFIQAAVAAASAGPLATAPAGAQEIQGTSGRPIASYRRIGVEEHFSTVEFSQLRARQTNPSAVVDPSKLRGPEAAIVDLGNGRIGEMDRGGIAMQVLSHTTGTGTLENAFSVDYMKRANDLLAATVRGNPARLAGMALVCPQVPAEAAKEIERCATQLKLTGAVINSTTHDEFLDDPKYLPVFEALAAFDMPLFLHPAPPPKSMAAALDIPGFNTGWGFGAECGTHACRIIAAGVFDRFPALKLKLGHLGEGLPNWIHRIDNQYPRELGRLNRPVKLRKLPGDYLRENIYVNTSGFLMVRGRNYWPQLKMVIDTVGIDHVLFAVDYPFEPIDLSVEALDSSPLTADEKARIYYRNAERLYRIQPG